MIENMDASISEPNYCRNRNDYNAECSVYFKIN